MSSLQAAFSLQVYNLQHKPLSRMLSEQGLQQLLEAWSLVHLLRHMRSHEITDSGLHCGLDGGR